MSKKVFYQITKDDDTRTADINIYGDITGSAEIIRSWIGDDGSVSARDIKREIDGLDVDTINVYINSYGGEVAEALAIYSALQRHKAQVHTYCDGFACSAATIIFCAGDVRTMGSIALMMIHNCMSYIGYANSEEMRKAAEDNDKINQSSIEAYKKVSNLSEDEIKQMMNAETWLTAQECFDYGFATEIAGDDDEEDDETQQSAMASIHDAILGYKPDMKKFFNEQNARLDQIQKSIDEMNKESDPSHLDGQKQTDNFLQKFFKNLS